MLESLMTAVIATNEWIYSRKNNIKVPIFAFRGLLSSAYKLDHKLQCLQEPVL